MPKSLQSDAIYVIADLHLAQNRPDITACFLSFLTDQAKQANALYILGDLFEYWIGDDDNSPWLEPIKQALKALSSKVPIYFIHGNRDFLIGKTFAKQTGLILLPELYKTNLLGHQCLLMHGDTLCTRDVDYQAFRKKSRRWWWQAIVKSLPLAMRRKKAENYRSQSAISTAMKAQDIMDVTPEAVTQTMLEHQCYTLIHGHTHRPAIHEFKLNQQLAKRIVVGDWYTQGSWLKITEQKIELLFEPFATQPPSSNK